MIIPALMALATLACQPDANVSRETREADAAEMNVTAAKQGANMTFDVGGTEAHTLIIHSIDEQKLSDNARCRIAKEGFLLIVNVYGKSGSNYRLWELGR
jgi:hypothetical protein